MCMSFCPTQAPHHCYVVSNGSNNMYEFLMMMTVMTTIFMQLSAVDDIEVTSK